ncbi:MAG: hypothetical protein NZ853_10970 [Leptospiraceae bacterium]|nr:hypothetical protein [Leptospiraceae bacterium]MDW7975518.1 hypothetical protein [Leptospiraceae bacterium]
MKFRSLGLLLYLISYNSIFSDPLNLPLKPILPKTENVWHQYLQLGDYYYKKKYYTHALFYYEFLYKNKYFNNHLKSKLLLNYLQLKEKEFLKPNLQYIQEILSQESHDFSENYIQLYASFRFGFHPMALVKMRALMNSSIPEEKKDYAKLIFGSLYFEEGNFHQAIEYYEKLKHESQNQEVQKLAEDIIEETQQLQKEKFKNPLIASFLSLMIPGSGYFYTGSYVEGTLAFFWNLIFFGGGIYIYQLESQTKRPHLVSYAFLVPGVILYVSQILGSYANVMHHNHFRLRVFYQKLRSLYFHTDFIERTSGIEFQVAF